MAEFAFGEVSCLVAKLTSTSSKEVQSLVPGVVSRIFSLTFVFLEMLWDISYSVWATMLYLIVQWQSQSCWRMRIFSAWIAPEGPGPKYNRTPVGHSRETLGSTSATTGKDSSMDQCKSWSALGRHHYYIQFSPWPPHLVELVYIPLAGVHQIGYLYWGRKILIGQEWMVVCVHFSTRAGEAMRECDQSFM